MYGSLSSTRQLRLRNEHNKFMGKLNRSFDKGTYRLIMLIINIVKSAFLQFHIIIDDASDFLIKFMVVIAFSYVVLSCKSYYDLTSGSVSFVKDVALDQAQQFASNRIKFLSTHSGSIYQCGIESAVAIGSGKNFKDKIEYLKLNFTAELTNTLTDNVEVITDAIWQSMPSLVLAQISSSVFKTETNVNDTISSVLENYFIKNPIPIPNMTPLYPISNDYLTDIPHIKQYVPSRQSNYPMLDAPSPMVYPKDLSDKTNFELLKQVLEGGAVSLLNSLVTSTVDVVERVKDGLQAISTQFAPPSSLSDFAYRSTYTGNCDNLIAHLMSNIQQDISNSVKKIIDETAFKLRENTNIIKKDINVITMTIGVVLYIFTFLAVNRFFGNIRRSRIGEPSRDYFTMFIHQLSDTILSQTILGIPIKKIGCASIDVVSSPIKALEYIKRRLDGYHSTRRKSTRRKSTRRKSTRRKSVRRKSTRRKSIRRKSTRRKSIRRKSVRRKSVRR
jgi:hypothetical protein